MSDTPTLPELITALSERGIDLSGASVRMGSYGDSEQSELPSVFRLPEAPSYAAVSFVR